MSIRLVKQKARATTAGVRAMYMFIPAKHFNIDLCLDTISVLNRTIKDGYTHTLYQLSPTFIATSDAAGES